MRPQSWRAAAAEARDYAREDAADARRRKRAPRIHALLDDLTEAWRDNPDNKALEMMFARVSSEAELGGEASESDDLKIRQTFGLPAAKS